MKTYYIIFTNCDCSSNIIAVTSTKWVFGPRCRGCGRILGWMQYSEYGKVRANDDLEAVRKWKGKK